MDLPYKVCPKCYESTSSPQSRCGCCGQAFPNLMQPIAAFFAVAICLFALCYFLYQPRFEPDQPPYMGTWVSAIQAGNFSLALAPDGQATLEGVAVDRSGNIVPHTGFMRAQWSNSGNFLTLKAEKCSKQHFSVRLLWAINDARNTLTIMGVGNHSEAGSVHTLYKSD